MAYIMTRATYIYHPRCSMAQMHRAIHGCVLFYFIASRAPYGVYSPMWRIKHEWTERSARGVNGTGLAGRNGDRERSAQRKLRVRYCNGDEERQPVRDTRVYALAHVRPARAHVCATRNVDTVKVQWSADWLSLRGSLFRGIIVNRMTEALGCRRERQTISFENPTKRWQKSVLVYLINNNMCCKNWKIEDFGIFLTN
jgi:hypothetical protein